jgi:hypothetical protein
MKRELQSSLSIAHDYFETTGKISQERTDVLKQLTPHELHEEEAHMEYVKHRKSYERFLELLRDGGRLVDISANLSEAEMAELIGLHAEGDTMSVDCIDEGVGKIEGLQLGIGGGGILLAGSYLDAFVDFLLSYAKERRYKHLIVRSHRKGCGAAKLASGESDLDKVDAAADDFIAVLYEKLQQKNTNARLEIQKGVVEAEEMYRPEALHNAFGIFVDTTGMLNITRESEDTVRKVVPPMFNVSAIYGNDEHCLANIGVALNIASGDHGLSHKFTAEKPLIISIAVDTRKKTSLALGKKIEDDVNRMIAQASQREPGKWVPTMVKVVNFAGVLR